MAARRQQRVSRGREYADISGLVKEDGQHGVTERSELAYEGIEQSSGTVLVGDLPSDVFVQQLRETAVEGRRSFGSFGEIDEIYLSGRRTAAIRYYSKDSAQHAVHQLRSASVGTFGALDVRLADEEPDRNRSQRTAAVFGAHLLIGNMVKPDTIETYHTIHPEDENSRDFSVGAPDPSGRIAVFFCLTRRTLRIAFKERHTHRTYKLEWQFHQVRLRPFVTNTTTTTTTTTATDNDLHLAIVYTCPPKVYRDLNPSDVDLTLSSDAKDWRRVEWVRVTDPWHIGGADEAPQGGGHGRHGVTALEVSWCVVCVCPGKKAHFESHIAPSLLKAGLLQGTHDSRDGRLRYAVDPSPVVRVVDRASEVEQITKEIHRVSKSLLKRKDGFVLLAQYHQLITNGILQGSNAVEPSFVREGLLEPDTSSQIISFALDSMFRRARPSTDPKQDFDKAARWARSNLGLISTPIKCPDHCVRVIHVQVTPLKVVVGGEYIEQSNRVLRHFCTHTDQFMRVSFVDEDLGSIYGDDPQWMIFAQKRLRHVLEAGIRVPGLQHTYRFLGCSSSQLRTNASWFFASSSRLSLEDVERFLGDFSGIDTPGKYVKAQGLPFSSTRSGIHVPMEQVLVEADVTRPIDPDFPQKGTYEFTDGCGVIHPSLMSEIWEAEHLADKPCAIQFRHAGDKGMLLMVDEQTFRQRYPHPIRMVLRKSQRKFTADHHQLEYCDHSRFLPENLNREIIMMLDTRGIPHQMFVAILKDNLRDGLNALRHKGAALRLIQRIGTQHSFRKTIVQALQMGFCPSDDPFLRSCIRAALRYMHKDVRIKTHLYIHEGAYLFGVSDEVGVLEADQVFIQIQRPDDTRRQVITGPVVVARNPCLHAGDLRVLTAVDHPQLRPFVNVIVFPVRGDRPIPNQLSGGDLDGDQFHILWDGRLIPTTPNPPAAECYVPDRSVGQPAAVPFEGNMDTRDGRRRAQKSYIVRHFLHYNLGVFARACLAMPHQTEIYAHRKALHPHCMRLAELHSQAVDFPKTGVPVRLPETLRPEIIPDFMAKEHHKQRGRVFMSDSPIGVVTRAVKALDDSLDDTHTRAAAAGGGDCDTPFNVQASPRGVKDGQRSIAVHWSIPPRMARHVYGHRITCCTSNDACGPSDEWAADTHSPAPKASVSVPIHWGWMQFRVQVVFSDGNRSGPSPPCQPLVIDVDPKYTAAQSLPHDLLHCNTLVVTVPFSGLGVNLLQGEMDTALRAIVRRPPANGPVVSAAWLLTEVCPPSSHSCSWYTAAITLASAALTREVMRVLEVKCQESGRPRPEVFLTYRGQQIAVAVSWEEDPWITAYRRCVEGRSTAADKAFPMPEPKTDRILRVTNIAAELTPCENPQLHNHSRSFVAAFGSLMAMLKESNSSYVDVLIRPPDTHTCCSPIDIIFLTVGDAEGFRAAFEANKNTLSPAAEISAPGFREGAGHLEQFFRKPRRVEVLNCTADMDELVARLYSFWAQTHHLTGEIVWIEERPIGGENPLGDSLTRPSVTYEMEVSTHAATLACLSSPTLSCTSTSTTGHPIDFFIRRPLARLAAARRTLVPSYGHIKGEGVGEKAVATTSAVEAETVGAIVSMSQQTDTPEETTYNGDSEGAAVGSSGVSTIGPEDEPETDNDGDAAWVWPRDKPLPPAVDWQLVHRDYERHQDDMRRHRDMWNHQLSCLMRKYGVAKEAEACMGCVALWQEEPTARERDAATKLSVELTILRESMQQQLAAPVTSANAGDDTVVDLRLARASAAYVVTRQDLSVLAQLGMGLDDDSETPVRDFLSFPWMVFPEELIRLKNRYTDYAKRRGISHQPAVQPTAQPAQAFSPAFFAPSPCVSMGPHVGSREARLMREQLAFVRAAIGSELSAFSRGPLTSDEEPLSATTDGWFDDWEGGERAANGRPDMQPRQEDEQGEGEGDEYVDDWFPPSPRQVPPPPAGWVAPTPPHHHHREHPPAVPQTEQEQIEEAIRRSLEDNHASALSSSMCETALRDE